jgi:hypothetical protein
MITWHRSSVPAEAKLVTVQGQAKVQLQFSK